MAEAAAGSAIRMRAGERAMTGRVAPAERLVATGDDPAVLGTILDPDTCLAIRMRRIGAALS